MPLLQTEGKCLLALNEQSSLSRIFIKPFCPPVFSLLQASPTKVFFCSQPTQGKGIVFQCREAISHQNFVRGATLQPQHMRIRTMTLHNHCFQHYPIKKEKKLRNLSYVPFKMPVEIIISNSFK